MNAVAMLDGAWTATDDHASVLADVMSEGIELTIWRRDHSIELAWLDELDWDATANLDFESAMFALDRDIDGGLVEAGYPIGRIAVLRNEIAALARTFATILRCAVVRLRLEIVETDACRKFHSDFVTARLLTTLVGPATQWIEATAPNRIHQLAAGEVAIFNGRRLEETPAILHRSPPIAGTGDIRLLLAIDALEFVSGDRRN